MNKSYNIKSTEKHADGKQVLAIRKELCTVLEDMFCIHISHSKSLLLVIQYQVKHPLSHMLQWVV